MSVPADIVASLTALQTAVTAAKPLEKAPWAQVLAVQQQAGALITRLDGAVPAAAGALDGPEPAGTPQAILAAFQGLAASGADQSALVDMRGFVGRAGVTLGQVSP